VSEPDRMNPTPQPPDVSQTPPRATPPRCRFPRRLRITRKRDFEHTMRGGVRVIDRYLMIWGRRNGLLDTRLGLVVGRRHGTAVRRNRLKRLIREAFRLSYAQVPRGLDLVCAPQAGAELTLSVVRASLLRLVQRLEPALTSGGTDNEANAALSPGGDGPPSLGTPGRDVDCTPDADRPACDGAVE